MIVHNKHYKLLVKKSLVIVSSSFILFVSQLLLCIREGAVFLCLCIPAFLGAPSVS